MKILGKYKDYFDYLVGKYGIDEKIIVDRRENVTVKYREYEDLTKPSEYTLAICGELFHIVFYRGNYYHTREELKTLNEILKSRGNDTLFTTSKWSSRWGGIDSYLREVVGKTKISDKFGYPIMVASRIYYNRKPDDFTKCLASEFGVPNYISAEEMYQKVYSWYSKRNEVNIQNNQTDLEKIESHGFDTVKSFRHRK